MTNVQLAGRLLTAPRRFFADLAESPRFALPMWLIVLTTCGLLLWFYSIVDTAWLIEQQLASSPRSAAMTDAQRDAAARFMTSGMLTSISVGGAFVVIFIFRLLETLWYKVASGVTGHKRSFRQWFAFAWWTSTPGLIGMIPAALLLLLSSTNQIDAGILQPLSLNELIFHKKMGEPGYQVLSNVSLLMLLSIGLTIFGIKCWSARSWLYSTLIVLLIPALFFGGWAAIALVRA